LKDLKEKTTMADFATIAAQERAAAGKGGARKARNEGRVPGVIYGNKISPVHISVDRREFTKLLEDPGFFTQVFDVKVGSDSHHVLARDVQNHPVSDVPLHVDFFAFDENTKINIEVPCVFVGEEDSPGIKRGGVLNVVRREVELLCNPAAIPHSLEFNLAGLDIGDSIHISSIQLPAGAEVMTDRDFTVATIAAPTILTAEEEAGIEVEEGDEGEEGEAEAGEAEEGGEQEGGDED
jgi:large subunit ribosomal protein L25